MCVVGTLNLAFIHTRKEKAEVLTVLYPKMLCICMYVTFHISLVEFFNAQKEVSKYLNIQVFILNCVHKFNFNYVLNILLRYIISNRNIKLTENDLSAKNDIYHVLPTYFNYYSKYIVVQWTVVYWKWNILCSSMLPKITTRPRNIMHWSVGTVLTGFPKRHLYRTFTFSSFYPSSILINHILQFEWMRKGRGTWRG